MSKISRKLFKIYTFLGKPLFGLLWPLYERYRKLAVGRSVVVTIDGITYDLDLSQNIDSSIYFKGCFEPATTEVIHKIAKPGMAVLDIGANMGAHTLMLAKLVGDTGRVIAFEPMEYAYNKLQRNLRLNKFRNVTLEKMALGNETGTLKAAFRSSWSLDGSEDVMKDETIQVMKLDDYLVKCGILQVDFIKLDVDGFEYKVLQGSTKTLQKFHPPIVTELGTYSLEAAGDQASAMLKELQALGYQFFLESDLNHPVETVEALLTHVPTDATINILCK